MRPECDRTPSMLGCLRIVRGVAVWTLTVASAAMVASLFHRGPDPRLLRAACASKTASHHARSLVSMASIPRRSEVIPMMAMAWEAEARAWADVDVGCE